MGKSPKKELSAEYFFTPGACFGIKSQVLHPKNCVSTPKHEEVGDVQVPLYRNWVNVWDKESIWTVMISVVQLKRTACLHCIAWS